MPRDSFLDNRHPDYAVWEDDWTFWRDSYTGGPAYRDGNHLFQFARERKDSYNARKKRTSRINFVAQVLDLVNSYLFKEAPVRKDDGVPNELKSFWEDVDRRGTGIDDFMRDVSTLTSVYGIYYVAVDKPAEINLTGTIAEREKRRLSPYCYGISPLDMLDVYYGPDGTIQQALVRETVRDASKSIDTERDNDGLKERFRVWKQSDGAVTWALYERNEKGDAVLLENGILAIPRVPIVAIRRQKGRAGSEYTGKSMASDFAELDRTVYNYESCLDQIIYDQTFSILALEYDGSADDFYEKWDKTISTKSFVPYTKGGNPPQFISPDASQGALITESVEKKINQIYRLSNLLSEVGDAQQAAAPESGVAKAYDFEKLNAVLGRFADDIERGEEDIASLVMMFEGDKNTLPDDAIDYPDQFDVKSLMQELSEFNMIALAGISAKLEGVLAKKIARKAAPKVTPEERVEIEKEIDDRPTDPLAEMERKNKASGDGRAG